LAACDRVLLGDYGYHAHDQEGRSLCAYQTSRHNTVVYGEDPDMGSGYAGLERAPEPAVVRLDKAFDWCVHRIVNTNLRPGVSRTTTGAGTDKRFTSVTISS